MEALDDLVQFLESADARVRHQAIQIVATLSGTTSSSSTTDSATSDNSNTDALQYLKKTDAPGLLLSAALRTDRKASDAVQHALVALVNMTADDAVLIEHLIKRGTEIGIAVVPTLLNALASPHTLFAELHAMLLCNITRDTLGCKAFLRGNSGGTGPTARPAYNLSKLVDALVFADEAGGAQAKAVQQWVAPILENVTQVAEGRTLVLDTGNAILPTLLPFVRNARTSADVRRGVLGVLKNCAFETHAHPQLLGLVTDATSDTRPHGGTAFHGSIVPYLLWPLRDCTVLPGKDNDLLHETLRNEAVAPARKTVDPDSETRRRVLDALLLLTKTRAGREAMRAQGVYPVLRVYDLMEHDEAKKEIILQLVELLMMWEERSDKSHSDVDAAKQLPLEKSTPAASQANTTTTEAASQADTRTKEASGSTTTATDEQTDETPAPLLVATKLPVGIATPLNLHAGTSRAPDPDVASESEEDIFPLTTTSPVTPPDSDTESYPLDERGDQSVPRDSAAATPARSTNPALPSVAQLEEQRKPRRVASDEIEEI